MMILILVALACTVLSASAEVSFEDWHPFAGVLVRYLRSTESTEKQVETLDDPVECVTEVRTWLQGIAFAMYPVFFEANIGKFVNILEYVDRRVLLEHQPWINKNMAPTCLLEHFLLNIINYKFVWEFTQLLKIFFYGKKQLSPLALCKAL